MGMPIQVDVRDVGVGEMVVERVFDWLRHVDATFSTYHAESEISRLNRGLLSRDGATADVRAVLDRCEELTWETDGYFDIRGSHLPVPVETAAGELVTSGIDPSGFVKGWAIDRAAAILDDAGARNYFINAGGDVRTRGGAVPEGEWRVGIRHPREHDMLAAVVPARDLAVATSGAYERGEHIVDPHTGLPPRGVLSVTVTGSELATADAYATAIFAMGEAGPAWTTRLYGYEAMVILEDDRVLSTRWFPKE